MIPKIKLKTMQQYFGEENNTELTPEPTPELFDEVIKLFSSQEKIMDSDVHALAEKLNISPHQLENSIYSILSSFVFNGRAKEKGITEDDVDPEELKLGIVVEGEHSTSKFLSERIALDHLAELSNYYTLLSKMEKEGKIKK